MHHSPGFLALVEAILPNITEISAEDYLAQPQAWTLIDVREDHEWQLDHLPNAIHIGRGIIERDIEVRFPDKDAALVLYCGGGFRSALSCHNLQLMGYNQVFSLVGGYRGWCEKQLPLVTD
ncbi:sulfurtransferase [Shewanella avicenniae]|uniref:Sulfurtransferase n=1 Tax=Shewanella avicenniae TaxID=2814294 RepID=A0ABX7QLV7_9GAMM|nr:rhodanese-like domain-containing protein [Shewanella avicenniae]QSX32433.1 sulfurtransferase [Shewanella avicenniae]